MEHFRKSLSPTHPPTGCPSQPSTGKIAYSEYDIKINIERIIFDPSVHGVDTSNDRTFSCKPSNFRKTVRNVINKAK
jgi:hypothetical protein